MHIPNIIEKIDARLFSKIFIYIYSVVIILYINYLFITLQKDNNSVSNLIKTLFHNIKISNYINIVIGIFILIFIGITFKQIFIFIETLINFHKNIKNNKCETYIKYVCSNFTTLEKIIMWTIASDVYDDQKHSIYHQRSAIKNGINLSISNFENESAKIISIGVLFSILFLIFFYHEYYSITLLLILVIQFFQIRITGKFRLIGIEGYSKELL